MFTLTLCSSILKSLAVIAQNKRLITILLVCGFMMLLPLLAMQFTKAVNWHLTDFIIAGLLLFGGGLALEFILRKYRTSKYKTPLLIAFIVLVLLLWMELAVGIFGSPLAGS